MQIIKIARWILGIHEPYSTANSGEKTASIDLRDNQSGCWWDHPEVIPLKAGSAFNVNVVGEARWQENLSSIVGGKRPDGYDVEVVAQLVFEANPVDANAVGIMIDAKPVGWIAAADAPGFREEITRINPDRRALTCKAKITGGWDRGHGDEGHFGVKLSLAMPLQIDPIRKSI